MRFLAARIPSAYDIKAISFRFPQTKISPLQGISFSTRAQQFDAASLVVLY